MNANRLPLFWDIALAERIERVEAQLISQSAVRPPAAARATRWVYGSAGPRRRKPADVMSLVLSVL